jgi:hypothetical protein
MSFASSLAAPANIGIRSAGRLLRGGSLQSMARAVGVVLGAGVLAASYQIVYEEGRTIVFNLRANAQQRRARNDAAILVLYNLDIPIEVKEKLQRSRDMFRTGMSMLSDQTITAEHRTAIHDALTKLVNGQPHG